MEWSTWRPCTNCIDDDDWLRKTVEDRECEGRHDDVKIGDAWYAIVPRGLMRTCVYMMNIKKYEINIKTPV